MENMDCREFLGQAGVLMRQRKYDEALQYLDRAEQADQTNVDVYMAKGVCLASLQRYKEAEGQFETVLRLDRRNGLAQFHLGNIYMTTGFEAEGLDLYNRAIANGYGDSQIFFNLGLFYEEHDDEEMALRNYAKAYHANPGRADARVRQAMVYAIDRQQILEQLLKGNGEVSEGFLSSASPYYDDTIEPLGYDPEREHLAERSVDFERRAGLFHALAGEKEVFEMVRRTLRHFRKPVCHFRGFFIRDDRQGASVAASLEGEVP